MKKKVKLFSTIASLCLAVALMAFGVWAATTANFGVTSTVKYSVAGQVDAEFKVTVEFNDEEVTRTTDNMTGAPSEADAGKYTYVSGKKTESEHDIIDTWSITQRPGESAKTQTFNLGDYAFNVKAVDGVSKIVYTITITNNAKQKLKVALSNGVTQTADSESPVIKCEVVETGLDTEKMVAAKAGETAGVYTYKVTYTLANGSTDADDITFNPNFALEAQLA